MTDLVRMLDVAREAVGIGTELVRNSAPHHVRFKSDRDTVTDIDLKVEQEIRGYLRRVTPHIGFLGEEEGQEPSTNQETIWTLDPIDGTSNFVHGVPLCAVSLALVDRRRSVAAAISVPFMDLHYYASDGSGAFVNGERMRVSRTGELSRALVSIGDYAVGPGAERKNALRLRLTALLTERVERIRMFGAAALDLAWVAEGRIDATVILANKSWDTSAGTLIARESGAIITDAQGKPHNSSSKETIAATPGIIDELVETLKNIHREPPE